MQLGLNVNDDDDRAYNNRRSQPGRPPMRPNEHMDQVNNSVMSGGRQNDASGNTPRADNYRKAFKPNLPSSS